MKRTHWNFVRALPGCNWNQTEAYLKVFPKAKRTTARARAAELMAKEQVKEAIQRLCEPISAEWVTEQLKGIATSSKARDADKIRSLELIGRSRAVNMFSAEVQQNTLNLISDQSINEIKARLKSERGTEKAQEALASSPNLLDSKDLAQDSSLIDTQIDTSSQNTGPGGGGPEAPTHP